MYYVKKFLFFTFFCTFTSNFNMDFKEAPLKPINFNNDHIKFLAKKSGIDINEVQKIINRKKRTFSLKIPLILSTLSYRDREFYHIYKDNYQIEYSGISITGPFINRRFEYKGIINTDEDFFLPFREDFKIDNLEHEVGIVTNFNPKDSLLSLVEKSQIHNMLFVNIPVEWIEDDKGSVDEEGFPLLVKKIEEYISVGGMDLPMRIILFRTGSVALSCKKSFFKNSHRTYSFIDMKIIRKMVRMYTNIRMSEEIDIDNIFFHKRKPLRLRIDEEIGDQISKTIDNFIQQSQWFTLKTENKISVFILNRWSDDFYLNYSHNFHPDYTVYFPYGVQKAETICEYPAGSSIIGSSLVMNKEFTENVMAQIQKKDSVYIYFTQKGWRYTGIIIHRIVDAITDLLNNDKKSDAKINIFIVPCVLGVSPEKQNEGLEVIKNYFDTNSIEKEPDIINFK